MIVNVNIIIVIIQRFFLCRYYAVHLIKVEIFIYLQILRLIISLSMLFNCILKKKVKSIHILLRNILTAIQNRVKTSLYFDAKYCTFHTFISI